MPIRITEKPKQAGSIQFRKPESRREFTISGSLSKLDIQLALLAYIPGADTGADENGDTISIFLSKVAINEIGGGVWHGIADYSNTPDQFDLKINIGTQTSKRQQALEHIRTYDCVNGGFQDDDGTLDFGSIPAFRGAIGVNTEQTEVAGVEVEI